MPILEVQHLYKNFGSTKVLKDISFTLERGKALAIIGSSGSGKTTLLRCLNFLETPNEGKIIVNGETLLDAADHAAKSDAQIRKNRLHFGMVFQSFNLFPQYTALENVMLAPLLQAKERPDYKQKKREIHEQIEHRAIELLEMMSLEGRMSHYPHQLSGGQQQRVALARALVAQPGLLLLDEPLSNLDAKLRESMRFEILSIQKALGITVVYVTHDQGEAMAMSDRVVVMSKGVVQQIGAPHEIYTNPANKMVADFIGLVNFMQGEVSDDRVYLQGTTASFPNTSGVSGSATIAVRPENITMSRGGGMLEGTLTHRFYLGDAVDYRVTVGDHDVRVIVKGADLKEFADGEKVYLDFEKVMIFDRE